MKGPWDVFKGHQLQNKCFEAPWSKSTNSQINAGPKVAFNNFVQE